MKKEEIIKLRSTIALLNSMINCGSTHDDETKKEVSDALKIINSYDNADVKAKRQADRMVKKYSEEKCVEAFELYDGGSMGASGVAYVLDVTTNTADALITAGTYLDSQEEILRVTSLHN